MAIYRYENSKVWWMDFIFDSVRIRESTKNTEQASRLGMMPATLRNWRCRVIGPAFHKLSRGPNGIKYAVEDLDEFLVSRRHVPSVRASVERVHGAV